jgi:plasmid stabilization system protein ParE
MDNIAEAVALLHRQAELEIRLANNPSAAVATERELEHLLRRLATHPHAVNAVLQTALALRRTPDAITAQDVETWTPAI